MSKKWKFGLLIIYVVIILSATVLFRSPYEGRHFQPQLFWSYDVWEIEKEQIVLNVLLFTPLGLIVGSLWKWKGILVGTDISLLVELLQLISSRGLFEFDDIIHNTLGTFIGVLICLVFEQVVDKYYNYHKFIL